MNICPYAIIKVVRPWHLLANDLAQLVNIFKEHVVVGHGPARPGNVHFPPKIRPNGKYQRFTSHHSVHTSETSNARWKIDSRWYRSPISIENVRIMWVQAKTEEEPLMVRVKRADSSERSVRLTHSAPPSPSLPAPLIQSLEAEVIQTPQQSPLKSRNQVVWC